MFGSSATGGFAQPVNPTPVGFCGFATGNPVSEHPLIRTCWVCD